MVAFPTLSSGGTFERYPVEKHFGWEHIIDDYDCGAVGSRDKWSKFRGLLRLTSNPLRDAEAHKILGFINDIGSDEFTIPDLCIDVLDPYIAPTLTETGGGALAGRTYYVKQTWSDGTNETRPSEQSTKVVTANNWIEVTMEKGFPGGVSQANIYIGTVSGSETFCGILSTSNGTWTEFSTTVDGDSNSGQKVLQVAATTGFAVGEMVVINQGGAREEAGTIATITAGVSITLVANLTYTHTAVQADVVQHAVDDGSALPTDNTLEYSPTVIRVGDPTVRNAGPNKKKFDLMLVEVF